MAENEDKKNLVVVWQGYEHEHEEKTRDWYWVLGIVSSAIAIATAILGNYLLAVLIIVSAFSIAVHAYEKPALKEFRIDKRGITVGNRIYPYENIESFFVDTTRTTPLLFLELKRHTLPVLHFPINQTNVNAINEIMREKMTEKEQALSLPHRIFEILGF